MLTKIDQKGRPAVTTWYGVTTQRTPDSASTLIRDLAGGPLLLGTQTRWVFRGHADRDHQMIPSLVRVLSAELGRRPTEDDLRSAEQRILNYAHDWGFGRSPWGPADDIQLMAELQHHGLPTRLLDVTANPFTALYFASQQVEDDHDGVVIAFNTTAMDEYRTDREQDLTFNDVGREQSARWQRLLTKSQEEATLSLIRPTFPNARMAAQEGMFISGACPPENADGGAIVGLFEPTVPDFTNFAFTMINKPGTKFLGDEFNHTGMIVIPVPASLKHDLRVILATTFHRSPETMFPDLDGLRTCLRGRTTLQYDAFSTAKLSTSE